MNPTVELLNVKADLTLKNNKQPITENEVLDILGNELPEINILLEEIDNPTNLHMVLQVFANYTKQLAISGNLKEVKHCFNIAENMMQEGNSFVKGGIKNCYIFSVSAMMDITSPVSQTVKNLLTDSLKKEYCRQVGAIGI